MPYVPTSQNWYGIRFFIHIDIFLKYSKIGHKQPLKEETKLVFKTDYRLMQVKSIAESILQYFRPSLRYHTAWKVRFTKIYQGV